MLFPFLLRYKLLPFEVKNFSTENPKLWRFKEKENIDEVKLFGYENPYFRDPTIFERILERLEVLERRVDVGQPFINRLERPDVGDQIARRVNVRPPAESK